MRDSESNDSAYVFGDYIGGVGPHARWDNVYLVRGDTLYVQPRAPRARLLHSFGRDLAGRLYALCAQSVSLTGNTGALYALDLARGA